jgi:diguanylate cyclase (GGDEF)-like protein
VAYPIFYVSTALVMLQAVVSGALDVRANRGLAAVLVGLVLEALAFILWSPLLLKGTYVAGTNVVDALWAVGMLLVGFGALSAGPPRAVAEVELVSERRGGALSALTLVVLAVAQALEILSDAVAGVELALGVGMAVVGATLIARASMLRAQQIVLFDRLRERERELEEANRRLSEESRRDPLTGLANRLRLREDLIELAARSERYGETYCLVLCDLDRFKDYNDELGHQAGDHALRAVAALLESHTRGGDCAYRYGGEELLIVLHGQDGDSGAAIAERHRANVEAAALPHPANPPTDVVTFSAGVAAAQPGETPAEVLLRADRALYRAKAAGRNRTAIAGPDQPLGPAALSSLT